MSDERIGGGSISPSGRPPAPAPVVDALRRLGSAAFRIDWFGDVAKSRRLGSTASTVRVCCSVWGNGETGSGDISVDVPVAFLRLFRMGDIWQGGRRVGFDPTLERVHFQGLIIDDATCVVGPAGLPGESRVAKAIYDLPFDQYPAHRSHTRAFVARVTVDDATIVVVPSVELLRFYFGASGALLTAFFSGAFAEREILSGARLHEPSGDGFVVLGKGIPGIAAPAVARIAFDQIARREVRNLVNGGVAAAASGDKYYPRMSFPFVGRTDLVAEGRWLGRSDRRVFIAERLLRCTHPFPFESLRYQLANGAPSSQRGLGAHPDGAKPLASDRLNTLVEATADGSKAASPVRNFQFGSIEPFPDLIGKPVRKTKSESGAPAGKGAPGAVVDGLDLASEMRGGGGSQAADVQAPDFRPDMPGGRELLELLKERVIGTLCGQVAVSGPAEVPDSGREGSGGLLWQLIITPVGARSTRCFAVVAAHSLSASDAVVGLGTFDDSRHETTEDVVKALRAADAPVAVDRHGPCPDGPIRVCPGDISMHYERRKCVLLARTMEMLMA